MLAAVKANIKRNGALSTVAKKGRRADKTHRGRGTSGVTPKRKADLCHESAA